MPGKGKPVPLPNIPPAPIFATLWASMGIGVAYLAKLFNLEEYLAGMVKPGSEGAWFCLMAAVFLSVNSWLGFLTVKARNKFGVGHPLVYPNKEDLNKGKGGTDADRISFICAVRGHENFLEGMAVFPLVLTALAVFAKQPLTAAAFGITSGIGRLLYGYGYGTGYPMLRVPGFLLHGIPYNTAQGLLFWYFYENAF